MTESAARRARLTRKYLKEALDYDPDTGVFRWKISNNQVRVGDAAGRLVEFGYIRITLLGFGWLAHILAWFWMTGRLPKRQIDHRNRKPSDNRWLNLRLASTAQNSQNKVANRRNTSGHVGVYLNRDGRWQAQLQYKGRNHGCGVFDRIEDAVAARALMSKQLRGQFAPENHS